ncbi:class I SAM-dependent methyltransferase [Salinisphaera sp. T31B1]|uniref:class I SAM-dependent methyltransferase n=1 Tax=Salinisphaera sp. T31B1 TaxID=727963 RepID=UPI00333EDE12
MSRSIDLEGFQATFAANPDPWGTYIRRDEIRKRVCLLRALGPGRRARVLELASGNGANSQALASRALALDACEGTTAGVALTAAALAGRPHARVLHRVLPGRLPRVRYEAIVIAELLYYLNRRAMRALARHVAAHLAPHGRLVLVHHHIDFHDTAQTAQAIHRRFLAATGRNWHRHYAHRNQRWRVDGLSRPR